MGVAVAVGIDPLDVDDAAFGRATVGQAGRAVRRGDCLGGGCLGGLRRAITFLRRGSGVRRLSVPAAARDEEKKRQEGGGGCSASLSQSR